MLQQPTKKVIVMTGISFGIILFAFLLPIVIIPTAINLNKANNCLDYNCANNTFTKCGVYQPSSTSSFTDAWSSGMRGMLCMLGMDGSAKATTVFAAEQSHITLNKAWLHIG